MNLNFTMLLAVLVLGCLATAQAKQGNRNLNMTIQEKDKLAANYLNLSGGYETVITEIVTHFSCRGRAEGYYADVANECKIFYVCKKITDANGDFAYTERHSFFCSNGTHFDQKFQVCAATRSALPCHLAPRYYGNQSGTTPKAPPTTRKAPVTTPTTPATTPTTEKAEPSTPVTTPTTPVTPPTTPLTTPTTPVTPPTTPLTTPTTPVTTPTTPLTTPTTPVTTTTTEKSEPSTPSTQVTTEKSEPNTTPESEVETSTAQGVSTSTPPEVVDPTSILENSKLKPIKEAVANIIKKEVSSLKDLINKMVFSPRPIGFKKKPFHKKPFASPYTAELQESSSHPSSEIEESADPWASHPMYAHPYGFMPYPNYPYYMPYVPQE